jgi:carboxypeptidase Taq
MKKVHKDMEKLLQHSRRIGYFSSLSYLANWDQETYMPKEGIDFRAEMMSFLAQEKHALCTNKKFFNLLEKLLKDPFLSKEETTIVERLFQDCKKQQKLGSSFVRKFSKETAHAVEHWKKAHTNNHFKQFLPSFKKVIALNQKKAELLGYVDHPYDALVDEYEPSMTTKQLDAIFGVLKPKLISLVKKITSKNEKGFSKITGHFSIEGQKRLCHDVIQRIGLKPQYYNLSTTHHPFCIPLHPHDIRVTTHFHEEDCLKGFSASIHEAGHGLYEHHLPAKYFGTPLAEAASLGIHESQSRIFETCLGNSAPFWKFYFPKFQKEFPSALENVSMEQFLASVRGVKPSLIRIFADEVTYCLHVILRYEIEKGLIDGSIDPKEVPLIWKRKMQESLGILPTSDATGCLQDIHWSIGAFGYFPTYALGSMYAGSLFTKFIKSHSDWASQIASGDFSSFSTFLKERVHIHGRTFLPFDLIEQATEKTFTPEDYITYLEHRFL